MHIDSFSALPLSHLKTVVLGAQGRKRKTKQTRKEHAQRTSPIAHHRSSPQSRHHTLSTDLLTALPAPCQPSIILLLAYPPVRVSPPSNCLFSFFSFSCPCPLFLSLVRPLEYTHTTSLIRLFHARAHFVALPVCIVDEEIKRQRRPHSLCTLFAPSPLFVLSCPARQNTTLGSYSLILLFFYIFIFFWLWFLFVYASPILVVSTRSITLHHRPRPLYKYKRQPPNKRTITSFSLLFSHPCEKRGRTPTRSPLYLVVSSPPRCPSSLLSLLLAGSSTRISCFVVFRLSLCLSASLPLSSSVSALFPLLHDRKHQGDNASISWLPYAAVP